MRKQDNHLVFNDGVGIYNSNLNYQWLPFIFADIDTDPGQVYTLDLKARADYDIQKLALISDTGTITVTVKINGTAVTGLTTIDATSTTTDYTATALNNVTEGDLVTLEITALADSPLQLTGNLLIKRV